MRWGLPEPLELNQYASLTIDGATVHLHHAIRTTASARIDLVTGGIGTKLILLGYVGNR